ncbi:conserved membrane hypothetical protein [Candidatus Methylobacter favarea]|uniref:DUF4010 domain-containing protein n=1 Tax=Candidatus Methylobacter favarea TaxID=2707345 RepID=A0A8S0XKW2_9GAMM|nr:DUF4010 domain-containing protein [Candidatus Methylobacter favarea]CAA9892342.1 conserved membrane hypothetical protein [Candidatus Methylobacter favarea]
MEFYQAIPPLLVQFALTVAFSFIVGLEFRRYHHAYEYKLHFGSTRTFVLIGTLGFILYLIDPSRLLFVSGLIILSSFLLIFYWRLSSEGYYSLLSTVFALLIYLIGPIATAFPIWFLVLYSVLLILLLGEKPRIHQISDQLANEEIVTLARFLIIAGVILPLLPDQAIAPMLPVSYYKIWLAVIIVSGFSYLSYLINNYFFKNRSLLITGVLGGLYSSTAATVVIAKRARELEQADGYVSSALIMATIMMYLRLLVIIFLFNREAGEILLVPFLTLIFLSSLIIAGLLNFKNNRPVVSEPASVKHPLELTTAIVFALAFVLFTFLTQYVTSHFGSHGLKFLAVSVGFTDIDPFILSLLSGKFSVPDSTLVLAVILSSGSNNLLKAAYAVALARNRSVLYAAAWLAFLFVISVAYTFKQG